MMRIEYIKIIDYKNKRIQNLNFDLGHSRLENFKPMVLAEFFTAFVRIFGSFGKSYGGIGTICF